MLRCEPLPKVVSSVGIKKLSGEAMAQKSLNPCVMPGAGSTSALPKLSHLQRVLNKTVAKEYGL